jgi:hypothetical protein
MTRMAETPPGFLGADTRRTGLAMAGFLIVMGPSRQGFGRSAGMGLGPRTKRGR